MKFWSFVVLLLIARAGFCADPPAIHGMLLFGKSTLYISHLPMFHRPHDYQAIAAIELPPDDETAYRKDAAAQPDDTIYTLVPERFSLPERFQTGKTFTVTLFRGHFERGGIPLFDSKVTLSQVVYFKKISPPTPKPEKQTLIAFGNAAEAFSAHQITGAPDFDQISQIRPGGLSVTGPTLLWTGAPNDAALKNGQTVVSPAGSFAVVHSLYVEWGDLAD